MKNKAIKRRDSFNLLHSCFVPRTLALVEYWLEVIYGTHGGGGELAEKRMDCATYFNRVSRNNLHSESAVDTKLSLLCFSSFIPCCSFNQ